MCPPDLDYGVEPKQLTTDPLGGCLDVLRDIAEPRHSAGDLIELPGQGTLALADPTPPCHAATKDSDARLAALAATALRQHPLIPAGKVRAVVRNAWLILEGEVDARVQRREAEDAIKGLPGIRGMSNNILIESEVMADRVSRRINEAFISNARSSASRISVSACDRKIILSGSVRSGVERDEAEMAAWGVQGVAHVVNRLRATS